MLNEMTLPKKAYGQDKMRGIMPQTVHCTIDSYSLCTNLGFEID